MFAVMFGEKVMFQGSLEECQAWWSDCYAEVEMDYSDVDDYDFDGEPEEEYCEFDEYEIVEMH